jgi:hypothetical protein
MTNNLYIIPRPQKNKYISVDIETNEYLEIIISECYRSLKKNNMCLSINKKKINLHINGYFKKNDDIYISITLNNTVKHGDNVISIVPLLVGNPIENVTIYNKKILDVIKLTGKWITNIYAHKTEFIYNFIPDDDIEPYILSIEFDLPYVDEIYTNSIITGINDIDVPVVYNITQYSY